MANPLNHEKALYAYVRSQGSAIAIKQDVWDFIHHRVTDNIMAIVLICQRLLADKKAMSAEEAVRILAWIKDIKDAISVVTTPSKESLAFPQFQDVIPLNPVIKELVTHQYGNDIYAMEFMLHMAVDPMGPEPIPTEVIQKILNHALSIKEFITKLEDTAQWKDSEQKYHTLYDSFQDGLFLTNMKGDILEVNQAYLDMLGYSEEEIKKINSQKFTPEKWHKKQEEIISNLVMTRGYSDIFEKEYIKKDGNVIPVDLKVWLIRDSQGEPLGIWGIARNITERKMAEKEAIKDILDSQMVIQKISDGITVSDENGHFEIFNLKMEEITGYTAQEANRQADFSALIHPDPEDRQDVYKRLDEIVASKGRRETQTAIQAKDGSQKLLLVSTSLINYKNRNMFLSVWRDITERKRLESALQKSEMSFRRLFETAQDGILILDADSGRIREVNPFLIDMLGYSREVFLGRELWEVGAFVDIDKSKTTFQRLQNEGYVRYDDLPLQTKDGRLINVEFVSNTYNVGQEKVIQCNIRDITERRHFELEREGSRKALKKSNKTLEELTLRDSQTGLYNHRHLKKALEANFSRAERQGRPLSVIMMDIDYFKSINDVYGHVFGDLVLRQFAAQLTKAVRPYDVVIRIGGEEFVVLSLDSDRAGALALAKRIQNRIKLYSFKNKKHSVKIKLSLAIASYPEDNVAKDEALMDLADQILNKAKENGGNIIYSSLDLKNGIGKVPETSDVHLLKEKIGKLTKRANQSLVEATFAFAKTIELKDCYTGKHVERTVHYAVKISQALDLSKDRQEVIKGSAMLHDLGKVGISELILRKKSKLSAEEFERIKRHPQIGVDIIRPIHFLRPIIPALLHHHERWDGKGYPQGLKGRRIPLEARILAIADVYQALVSVRPYKKAYSKAKSIKIIKKASGTQFDPDIVKTFLKILQDEKSGSRS